jgi:hypothetical protein
MTSRLIGFCFVVALFVSAGCAVKAAPIGTSMTICGSWVAIPEILPPADSGPVVLMAVPCVQGQGGRTSSIPPAYQRYVQLQPSRPADGVWIPFDAAATQMMQDDYRRLWNTGKLGDLSIEVIDYTFPNGVIGKFVTYTLQER